MLQSSLPCPQTYPSSSLHSWSGSDPFLALGTWESEENTSSPHPHTQKARRRAGLESRWAQSQLRLLPCMHTHTQPYMHTSSPATHTHTHILSYMCNAPYLHTYMHPCTHVAHICTHAPLHAPTYTCTVKHSYMYWLQCLLPTQSCTKS